MKMFAIIAAVVMGVFLTVCGVNYVSTYNYGNRTERALEAEYENLQNVLSQYSLQIKEAAQIPSMQTDDLARLFTGALDARYGSDGSQAAMQWIREQNPNLNQETYLQLQRMMEAGRNKFENHQTRFLDTKRQYETALGYLWQGFWLRVTGYPRIDLDDMNIVKSGYAVDSFETGIEEGIKLR